MQLGIESIASYIPKQKISNFIRAEKFSVSPDFIRKKLGIEQTAVKSDSEETSDMCVKAFEKLDFGNAKLNSMVQCLVVITQNPDFNLPHTAAIIQSKIGLSEECACFDVSLGCSGFVYGLSIVQSFMESNGFTQGMLFTCDPYSKIINPEDKSTALIFGDAASVTLISDRPVMRAGRFNFGTIGKQYRMLINHHPLYMNGREIFNFAAKYVPEDVKNVIEKNDLTMKDIDIFAFHQGSKFILDTIVKRLGIDKKKVVYDLTEYGNTVSSSIPIVLEKVIHLNDVNHILVSGFGVGLSWASTILTKSEVAE